MRTDQRNAGGMVRAGNLDYENATPQDECSQSLALTDMAITEEKVEKHEVLYMRRPIEFQLENTI